MRVEQRLRSPLDVRAFRSCLGCVAFLAGILLAASSATAAASEESLERAAKKACLAGDVAKGVAILADLYVRTDDPVFIFNQGRCFEQNGRYQDAIIRFREFLQKRRDAGQSSDASAEQHIAQCQALLDAQRQRDKPEPSAAPAPTAAQPSVPVAPAAPSAPAPAPAPSVAPPPPPPPQQLEIVKTEPRHGWWLGRKWAWVAAGSTVLLAGAAVGVGVSVNSRYDELDRSCGASGTGEGCGDGDLSSLRTRRNITNVLWAVAGAAAVTTGVLFFVEGRRVAVAPVAGETTGLVAWMEF
jgi:hypothetical protein